MFKYGNRTLALLSVGGFCLALLSGCSWFESKKEKPAPIKRECFMIPGFGSPVVPLVYM
jgi:hypothetical protein